MTYCYTDFAFLLGLSEKKGDGLGNVLEEIASYLGFAPGEESVNHALTVLRNAGFIELPGEGDPLEVGASCEIRLTDAGKRAVSVPLVQKLLGRMNAVLHDHEKQFLDSSLPVPDNGTVMLAPHVFDELVQRLAEPEDYGPGCLYLSIGKTADGIVMQLRNPWEGESEPEEQEEPETNDTEVEDRSNLAALVGGAADDEYIPENKLTVTYADGDVCFADLLRAVHELVTSEEVKTRKVCLHNERGTYVLTLSPQEDGIRVTCASIRFNQKRFRGKRDSELDYAQCGDDVLRFTIDENVLSAMTDMAYTEVWEMLDENLRRSCNILK